MLARFFQKSEPISFLSLLFLLLIYILLHSFYGFSGEINFTYSIRVLFGFVFFSGLLFFGDFIIQKNYLTPANYYAIFIFVLLFGLFPSALNLSKISIAHLFILLASRRMYSIRTKKAMLSKLFDSGFYIGIAFLLYPISSLYLLLIYISYFIYIRVINKDLLLPLIGFLTPILVTFTYFFINDNYASFKTLVEINIASDFAVFKNQLIYIPSLVIIILTISAVFKNVTNRYSLDNEGRNNLNLVLNHFFIGIILFSISTMNFTESVQFLFLPTAILIGNLLSLTQKRWVKEMLLDGILLLTFIVPFL